MSLDCASATACCFVAPLLCPAVPCPAGFTTNSVTGAATPSACGESEQATWQPQGCQHCNLMQLSVAFLVASSHSLMPIKLLGFSWAHSYTITAHTNLLQLSTIWPVWLWTPCAVVPPGFYLKTPGQAVPCPQGEWKAGTSTAGNCTRYPAGVTTAAEAATSRKECKCESWQLCLAFVLAFVGTCYRQLLATTDLAAALILPPLG